MDHKKVTKIFGEQKLLLILLFLQPLYEVFVTILEFFVSLLLNWGAWLGWSLTAPFTIPM